ncbi:MAG: hypothetical protein NNA20_07380 [Nitrospira sp.]|nr:hypothetical protein [Nitrospira sp.]MCP9442400.1 hypothetical protein [Nitrospira sp.]
MTIMLIGFTVFTAFVWFFGTVMAGLAWRVFEGESNKIIRQAQQSNTASIAPPKHPLGPRSGKSAPPSPGNGPRFYIDRRQTSPR